MSNIINLRTPITHGERVAYVRALLEAIYREAALLETVATDGKRNTLLHVWGEGDDWLQIIVQEPTNYDAWLKSRGAL